MYQFTHEENYDHIGARLLLKAIRSQWEGALHVKGYYSGGDDSGGYDRWTIITTDGLEQEIDRALVIPGLTRAPHAWDRVPEGGRIPVTFVELLEAVYADSHGQYTFAGDYEVEGAIAIDVETGAIENHGQTSTRSWSEF